jgi:sugar lactone lactonase YvrE
MVFDPTGKHLKDIVVPAYSPTCTTWGGKNFDIIFAASGKDKRPQPSATDEGGHMFKYKPEGSKGTPKFEFAG